MGFVLCQLVSPRCRDTIGQEHRAHAARRTINLSIPKKLHWWASFALLITILFQHGHLHPLAVAGEWAAGEGKFRASPSPENQKSMTSNWRESSSHSWTSRSFARAGKLGGLSRVVGSVFVDTKSNWFGETKARVEPVQARANGEISQIHGLPSHAQGKIVGIYRAYAKMRFSVSAMCKASGRTASVVGGGSANVACAMGQPANYNISDLSVGCDTKSSKECGFTITGPQGVGVGGNWVTSDVGRYDQGPKNYEYFYNVPDTSTFFPNLTFRWQCDAAASISAFATPGWTVPSSADGFLSIEAEVSDVSLEVLHGPTEI